MPLVITKSINEMEPEDFVPIMNDMRVKRLTLQAEFTKQNNIRLGIQNKKLREKITKQMELLAKDMMAIDDRIAKAQDRLEKVQIISNQSLRIEEIINESED